MARISACVVAGVVALGYYSHVRAQEGNSANTIVLPLRPLTSLANVPVPPIFGVEGIVADKTAAVQLGKALFWDMQAGSDEMQACASCHFNAGADSRPANVVNPGQAGGDNSFQLGPQVNGAAGPNYIPHPGSPNAGFGGYHDGDFPFHKLADPNNRMSVVSDLNDVAGSAGVFSTTMAGVVVGQIGGDGKVDPDRQWRIIESFFSGQVSRRTRCRCGLYARRYRRAASPQHRAWQHEPTLSDNSGNNNVSTPTVGTAPGSITSVENTVSILIQSFPIQIRPRRAKQSTRDRSRGATHPAL